MNGATAADDGIEEDLAAWREGAALVERDLDLVELAGPDRLRLLQGLVTADLKVVPAGAATAGFFTTGQGRILADFRLLAREESCWLLLPRGTAEAVRAHLEKYKVASRVEIFLRAERRHWELSGPQAAAAARLLRDENGEIGELFSATGPAAGSLFFLSLPPSEAEDRLAGWIRKAAPVGLRRLGDVASGIARVEAGELRFGIDFSSENLPHETGREGDISYTKGCYLGQEVVARIHYRGGVQRQPRGLRFTEALPPAPGTELLYESRSVGRATSVASSPRFGAIGLGLVHQRGAALGTRLEVAGGGSAEVVELPFEARRASG